MTKNTHTLEELKTQWPSVKARLIEHIESCDGTEAIYFFKSAQDEEKTIETKTSFVTISYALNAYMFTKLVIFVLNGISSSFPFLKNIAILKYQCDRLIGVIGETSERGFTPKDKMN